MWQSGKGPFKLVMAYGTFHEIGFKFYRTFKPIAKTTSNLHIIGTIDYTTKWAKARAFKDNTTKKIAMFIYENIITRFGCPTHFISDQRNQIINKTIEVLVA
jgi:hypothetical protein